MTTNTTKPSLNQLSSLLGIITSDPALNNHFKTDDAWSKISEMSYEDYHSFLRHLSNKERFKLNELMLTLGFKRTINQ